MSKCAGVSKLGTPCRFTGTFAGYCAAHIPDETERKRVLAERSANGGAAHAENVRRRKRKECTLRTVADVLTEIERTMLAVDNSGANIVSKATAKARLIAEARATLKASELETENAELRALLLELHPELATHRVLTRASLRSVK
jgi:hypothetical protein